jgi:hypothetical protein
MYTAMYISSCSCSFENCYLCIFILVSAWMNVFFFVGPGENYLSTRVNNITKFIADFQDAHVVLVSNWQRKFSEEDKFLTDIAVYTLDIDRN